MFKYLKNSQKYLSNRYKKNVRILRENLSTFNVSVFKSGGLSFKNIALLIFSIFRYIFIVTKLFIIDIILIITLCPIFIYLFVKLSTLPRIYESIEEVPYNKTALVLGTSKYLSDGRVNMYFHYRMKAAYELYKNGKVSYILVSGDNRHKSYNEPKQMKEDLIQMGVDGKHIFLDFAGFRTLDSILRAKNVFGLNSFTIVSQQFHNERAIFIAKSKNINAIGYNAKNVRKLYRLKQFPREVLSRVLMVFDLIFNRQAKFYGEPQQIGQ